MMPFNPPKTERNAEIYGLYLEAGFTLAAIARKYRITAGRVREIIDREERRAMEAEKAAMEAAKQEQL